MKNWTLSKDKIENNKVGKPFNQIKRELDPIAITIKNNEIDSSSKLAIKILFKFNIPTRPSV